MLEDDEPLAAFFIFLSLFLEELTGGETCDRLLELLLLDLMVVGIGVSMELSSPSKTNSTTTHNCLHQTDLL